MSDSQIDRPSLPRSLAETNSRSLIHSCIKQDTCTTWKKKKNRKPLLLPLYDRHHVKTNIREENCYMDKYATAYATAYRAVYATAYRQEP